MKRQNIKECFDRVVPDEGLIADTASKVERVKQEAESKSGFTFAFSYRLASAMCALVLVLGLGALAIRNPAMVPHENDAEPAEQAMRFAEEAADVPTAHTVSDELQSMAERAAARGGEWAVIEGSLDGCYFNEVTPDMEADGILFHCTLVITPSGADSVITSDGTTLPYVGDSGAVSAELYITDAEFTDTVTDSVSGYVSVSLVRSADGSYFAVEEIIPVK